MEKDGRQQERVQVEIKSTKGAKASDRRTETVSMCWTERQSHAVPAGMTSKQFQENHTTYHAYYVYDARDLMEHFHMGQGRPFATCCLGCHEEFGKNPVNASIGVPEDLRPSFTPVLGLCCCVTCLKCVYAMPLLSGKWRPCRACLDPYAHEAGHLMYPATMDTIRANNEKARAIQEAMKWEEYSNF